MFLFTCVALCLGLVAAYQEPKYNNRYNHGYDHGYDYRYDHAYELGYQHDYKPVYKHHNHDGFRYKNKLDHYGYGHTFKKYECKTKADCIKGYLCSDNFCVPDCGPCSEFDFTKGYCRYLCAKNAKCVSRGKYNYKCFCPYCPGMDGYDKYANCRPPKYLKGICYSYDRLTKAFGLKHGHGYKYDNYGKEPHYYQHY